jgi:hypothetical protein
MRCRRQSTCRAGGESVDPASESTRPPTTTDDHRRARRITARREVCFRARKPRRLAYTADEPCPGNFRMIHSSH